MESKSKIRVWDLPLRLFHLALLLLVSVSLYTGLTGGFTEMEYHMYSGYCILALLGFRIAWGFVGSRHSRFTSFILIKGLIPYARKLLRRDGTSSTGHNPLGALSVLAMLASLLTQAVTGLFADDDIMTEGPLSYLVSSDTGDLLTTIHHYNSWVLYGLLGLHFAAIAFYELYKRERLILPMITGMKLTEEGSAEKVSKLREMLMAMALIAISGGLVYYFIAS